MGNEQFKTEI